MIYPVVWNERVHLGCLYKLKLPHDLGREGKTNNPCLSHTDRPCPSDWANHLKISLLLLTWNSPSNTSTDPLPLPPKKTVLLTRKTFPNIYVSYLERPHLCDICRNQCLVSCGTLLFNQVKIGARRSMTFW